MESLPYSVGVSGNAPEPYAPHAQILLLYYTPTFLFRELIDFIMSPTP